MFEDIQKLHHSNEKFKVSLHEFCQNVLFFLFIRWAVGVSTGHKPRLEVVYSYTQHLILLMDGLRFTTSLGYLNCQVDNLCIFMKSLCVYISSFLFNLNPMIFIYDPMTSWKFPSPGSMQPAT